MRNLIMTISRASVALAVLAIHAPAQEPARSFSIHGYLTQGYGLTSRDTVMGLTPQGTTDYRRAAVVARYGATTKDYFVVQLAHRRLGNSPTMRFEENVKVDMAFYEHRFAHDLEVRIGKAVLPSGIYNDIRYVGTLLPFYRAPYSVYQEGAWTSETIDGVVATQRLHMGESWELATDGYAGGFDLIEFGATQASPTSPPTYAVAKVESKNVLGTRLWLTTPVEGLRVGASGRRKEEYGGINTAMRNTGRVVTEWISSVDFDAERVMLRAEAGHIDSRVLRARSAYLQLGLHPMSWLDVNLQHEQLVADYDLGPAGWVHIPFLFDRAGGLTLRLAPNTVVKLEAHATRGFNIEQVINVYGPAIKGSYFISSMSVSF